MSIDVDSLTAAAKKDWEADEPEEDDDLIAPASPTSASQSTASPPEFVFDTSHPVWTMDIWAQLAELGSTIDTAGKNSNSVSSTSSRHFNPAYRLQQLNKIKVDNDASFASGDTIRRLAAWLRSCQGLATLLVFIGLLNRSRSTSTTTFVDGELKLEDGILTEECVPEDLDRRLIERGRAFVLVSTLEALRSVLVFHWICRAVVSRIATKCNRVIICTVFGPTRGTEVLVVFVPQDRHGRPVVTLKQDLAAVELQLSKTWKYAPLSNLKSILSKVSQYAQSIRNAIVSVVKSAIDPNPSSKSSTRSSSLPPSLLLALDSATGNGRGVRVTRHGNPNLVDTAVALERPCFSVLLRAINSGGSADKYFATKAPSTDGQGEYAIAIKLLSQGSTADMVGEENRKMMGKSGGKAVEMVPLTGRSRVAYSEVPFARGISKNGAFGGSLLSLASFDRFPGVSMVVYSKGKDDLDHWRPLAGYGFHSRPNYSRKVLHQALTLLDLVLRARMGCSVNVTNGVISLDPLYASKKRSKYDVNALLNSHSNLVDAINRTPILVFPGLFDHIASRIATNALSQFGGKISKKEVQIIFEELERKLDSSAKARLTDKYGGKKEAEMMVEGLDAGQEARRAERRRNHDKPLVAAVTSQMISTRSSSIASNLSSSLPLSSPFNPASPASLTDSSSSRSLSSLASTSTSATSASSTINSDTSISSRPSLATDIVGPRFETFDRPSGSKRRRI